MSLQLNTSPGVVSVLYFLILDLIVLTVLDSALARIACVFYLRRIQHGNPVQVRTRDGFGLFSYIIGSFWIPVNVVMYTLKLMILACIIYIDLQIDSVPVRDSTRLTFTGLFTFDPSPEAWDISGYRITERRFETMRRCKHHERGSHNITFYSVTFKLSNNAIVDSEVSQSPFKIALNESELQCLSRGRVRKGTEVPIAKVVGCSTFATSSCRNETVFSISNVDIPVVQSDFKLLRIDYREYELSMEVRNYDQNTTLEIFPMYSKATMLCVRTRMGVSRIRGRGRGFQTFESCLVTSEIDGKDTLIERWEYNRRKLTLSRHFPGPVFQGRLQLAERQKTLALQNFGSSFNWLTFSSAIVADGAVYQASVLSADRLSPVRLVTSLPFPTVFATVLIAVASISVRIVVYWTLGKDKRPQINSLDGLPSVAREEFEPTGRSMVTGQVLMLGFSSDRNGAPDKERSKRWVRPVSSKIAETIISQKDNVISSPDQK